MSTTTEHVHVPPKPVGNADDPAYLAMLKRMQANFDERLTSNGKQGRLFTTKRTDAYRGSQRLDLWAAYLGAFPASERQHHNCTACRRFIERFGGLVTIDDDGLTVPVFWWPEEDPEMEEPFRQLFNLVSRSEVDGVFVHDSDHLYGDHGGDNRWIHLNTSLIKQPHLVHSSKAQTHRQRMAELRQDFEQVDRILKEYQPKTFALAASITGSNEVARAEKVDGVATWLSELASRTAGPSSPKRANRIWAAVAAAPAGYAHARSSMIGTLLEDIHAGLDLDSIKRRFAEKMHPLQYRRPQAPPAAGAIVAAEKLVEKLGLERSFERRYARLDELELSWRPANPTEVKEGPGKGIFAGLPTKESVAETPSALLGDLAKSVTTMTWAKFSAEILPIAQRVRITLPHGLLQLVAFTTAEHADAPPILQWDRDDNRNPVAWYQYMYGTFPSVFGIRAGVPLEVAGIANLPCFWKGATTSNYAQRAMLVLEGKSEAERKGSGIFPECLRSELHGIRSVVEAHSARSRLPDTDKIPVGLSIAEQAKKMPALTFVVTASGIDRAYQIDRWD